MSRRSFWPRNDRLGHLHPPVVPASELRHRERKQHKKEVVDAPVARATEARGLLLVLTGNGKGKSSSAFGMLARALGHGFRVSVAQFVKRRGDTGEAAFFRQHRAVTWRVPGSALALGGSANREIPAQIRTARRCPALCIAAPASGQGKTTITAGLARLYRDQGLRVRVLKTGPDFLDPMILDQASGGPVYQLDLWMGGETHCSALPYEAAGDADRSLVRTPWACMTALLPVPTWPLCSAFRCCW